MKQGPRVAAEAAALDALRHGGVVELVDFAGGTLRTHRVEGACPLAHAGPFSDDEIAGLLASVATTLADLHAAGIVHGGIDATHVLLHPEGRTVLCSLGRGGIPADDVAALGRLVTDLLASPPPAAPTPPKGHVGWRRRRSGGHVPALFTPPVGPVLAELAAAATAGEPSERPTARALATAVHQRVGTARVPRPPGREPLLARPRNPDHRRRPARHAGLLLSGLLGLPLLLLAGTTLASPDTRPPPASGSTTTTSTATEATTTTASRAAVRVWPTDPLDYEGGVLTVEGVRYAVGQPGDAVVAGDWACTGRRTVALLRPPTGEVFAFDAWADAGEVAGRLVGTVEGAAGLRAVPGDDGCDDLEVARPDAEPVLVDAAPEALR